jgi:hypothetical protein
MNLTLQLANNVHDLSANKVAEPPKPAASLVYLASDEFGKDMERLLALL